MSATDISRFLPKNEYDAAINAAAPTAVNPFATIADLSGFVSGNIYTTDGTISGSRTVTVAAAGGSLIFADDGVPDPIMIIWGTGIINIGRNAANGANDTSFAAGRDAAVNAINSIALGYGATTTLADATALGYNASASGARSVAIGENADAQTTDAIAISGIVTATGGVAIGNGSSVTAVDGVAIGNGTTATNGVSIGDGVTGTNLSVIIGDGVTSTANRQVIINGDEGALAGDLVAIGYNATGYRRGVSLGYQADVTGINGIAIGYSADAVASAIAIGGGTGAQATSTAAIAIGNNSSSANGIAIGNNTDCSVGLVSIGGSCDASGSESIAIGGRVIASGADSIGMGSSQSNANSMTNATSRSFGIGFDVINPHILLAVSTDSYFNTTGKTFIGDGSAAATEGAPNNIPTNYEKLAVLGNVEAIGAGNGFVAEADNGTRVLMKLVNTGGTNYAWDTGTELP